MEASGIHRRVDAQVRRFAGENRGGVQVGEGGGRRRVGVVVGGHVDGLHRGDGTLLGGGDALLQLAHLGGQGGLVAHGRGHAAQQGGDLGAGLGEAEDVVDEQQHVLAFFVAEVLGHREAGEGHPGAGAGRFVHLAVDQRHLGLSMFSFDDAGFLHLQPEVVALAGALADAGEHREAAVVLGDVVDQFHDQHGLAHAGAAEQAGLAALGVGRQQVDDLDAGLEHLGRGVLVLERGGLPVDGQVHLVADGAPLVHGLAHHVHDAAQGLGTDRHLDRAAGVDHQLAAHHAVGGVHGDAADPILAQVLLHLQRDLVRPRPGRW